MATRTIKRAAGKSTLTEAAVRTVVRQAAGGMNEVTPVPGRSGASHRGGRNGAGASSQEVSHAGAVGAKRRKP